MEKHNDVVLSPADLENELKSLPGWEVRDGWLRRKYVTPGWPHTMLLLVLLSLRLVHARRHLFAGICLTLAALSRPVGVPLGMTLLVLGGLIVWQQRRHGRDRSLEPALGTKWWR